uniref:Uncharacterized protein n=1 Tax=Cucumis melo TaxID=3656 RepID=A0A9I9DRW7_CUCME
MAAVAWLELLGRNGGESRTELQVRRSPDMSLAGALGLELHKAGQRWRRFQAEMKGPAAAELPDSEREAAAELSDSEKEAAVNPKEWKNKKGKN